MPSSKVLVILTALLFSQAGFAKTCQQATYWLTNVNQTAKVGALKKNPTKRFGNHRGITELNQLNVTVQGDYIQRGRIYKMAAPLGRIQVQAPSGGYESYDPFYIHKGVVYTPWSMHLTLDTYGELNGSRIVANPNFYQETMWSIEVSSSCRQSATVYVNRYSSKPN